jgi:hypothetical protein
MMGLTTAPCHHSPLGPPGLRVKAALMEAEAEGGGGSQEQQGQATINNM